MGTAHLVGGQLVDERPRTRAHNRTQADHQATRTWIATTAPDGAFFDIQLATARDLNRDLRDGYRVFVARRPPQRHRDRHKSS